GESSLVIGVRSAVFAPLKHIGLIVVDEEHDQSYKQENSPRYNARDLAIVRAKENSCPIILGSATPSLESVLNTRLNKYKLLSLHLRPTISSLPKVTIIDMRKEGKRDIFSEYLSRQIGEKLRLKEQIMILHNRRGFSAFVQCRSCGEIVKCRDCDISMHFHKDLDKMMCHYCGHTSEMPRSCSKCGEYSFKLGTPGTQKIEEILNEHYPEANILRLDSDTSRKKNTHSEMFDAMHGGEIDILLGTQMIAKGLDFPNVTLAAVVSADLSLSIPDFRAAERSFQLLTQIAGRAGRADKAGEVIIQTYNPEHYAIRYVALSQTDQFINEELSYRKALKYPPYYKLARIVYLHKNEKLMTDSFKKLKVLFSKIMETLKGKVTIFGPIPAPLTKIKLHYRYHTIIKAETVQTLHQTINLIKENSNLPSSIQINIDIDPYNLL
ncbi:MAG: primosomal protein N', partial [Candidatus Cloacimonetes bacterium]|nr:primosomal protein N' [Candidatus Cloacimonadota bacterium]